MVSTGIALFVYDRPDHLRKVLSNLKRNRLNHIYIFSDGPKKGNRINVKKVREVINSIDWCETTVYYRDKNWGLIDSILSGIRTVFDEHDRIIVLEDDCMPSADFIEFMQLCLNKYQNKDRVMNISGYCPAIDFPNNYSKDVFFSHRSSSWGWATWQDCWEHYEYKPMDLDYLIENEYKLREFTDSAGWDLYRMMKNDLRGEINSWAVWWSYAIVKRDGVCLKPVNSRIKNIGHDGSGSNSIQTNRFDTTLKPNTDHQNVDFPDEVSVNRELNKKYVNKVSNSSRIRKLRWAVKKKVDEF
ncbi:glycosyltransferase [Halorubrum sp. GN11GM_10-3_MGM]|uniref:glycosyltransferase n=1 Tax=Halorubrum sp. GN11GM_10-3_MGM TaxID=2518111 RepID=UPI0010FA413A|nr:glycosyltransferase [Halorubrum sp. GN11GM_10-3_MGM]TKX69196.1 glycosyltransferase [Halorubrum sp. GN11GM_10-3_MGM]